MTAPARTLVTVLAFCWAGPLWAAPSADDGALPTCEGEPPELVNADDRAYDYELTCGKKTEQHSIAAKEKQKLKKKAGCALKLGDNEATKLFADMVCTIDDGKLTCDLL